jgi:hypothetical protein
VSKGRVTAPCNTVSRVSEGCPEIQQSGEEDEEAKRFFNSTFMGKYSVFVSKVCFLSAFAKSRKGDLFSSCLSVCQSVHLNGKTRLPLDRFL